MSNTASGVGTPPASVNNLVDEGLIALAEAARAFKDAHGRKPHVATLRRWAKYDMRGHKLETMLLGNRLMTSHRAAARFLAAINGGPVPPAAAAATATSAAERAGRELDALLR